MTVLIAHWDIAGTDFKKRCNLFSVFSKLLGMVLLELWDEAKAACWKNLDDLKT